MDLITVLLLLQMVALQKVAPIGAVSCHVTALAKGRFLHMLSEAFGPDCDPAWELANKTALTQGLQQDPDRVQNWTDRSLLAKICLNFTRFTATCPNGEKVQAECFFDCGSEVTGASPENSTTVDPSSKMCFGETCVDPKVAYVPLLVVAVAVAVALVGCVLYRKRKQKYAPYRTAAYSGREPEQEPALELKADVICA